MDPSPGSVLSDREGPVQVLLSSGHLLRNSIVDLGLNVHRGLENLGVLDFLVDVNVDG